MGRKADSRNCCQKRLLFQFRFLKAAVPDRPTKWTLIALVLCRLADSRNDTTYAVHGSEDTKLMLTKLWKLLLASAARCGWLAKLGTPGRGKFFVSKSAEPLVAGQAGIDQNPDPRKAVIREFRSLATRLGLIHQLVEVGNSGKAGFCLEPRGHH